VFAFLSGRFPARRTRMRNGAVRCGEGFREFNRIDSQPLSIPFRQTDVCDEALTTSLEGSDLVIAIP
jgi:hypothetical protein